MKRSIRILGAVGMLGVLFSISPAPGAAEIIRADGQQETPQSMRIDNAKDLARIRQARPEHYWKILQILADIQDQAEGKVGKWLQTTFDARDVSYEPLLLVTDPPKRRLAFRLDNARYEGVIVLTDYQPLKTPAK
ncbi:hypothetical protein [Undibacterium sp.]|jgi:hypothetical protein|uniref:hypothetical protein n=1 Tax=Undibacterium sp. TaxID=1914977 RepID=UPI002CD5DD6A|nr:hypothetical protein [Undibacterium sp.]HTD04791.1 hypothetical protein [Undibacterium sp.]